MYPGGGRVGPGEKETMLSNGGTLWYIAGVSLLSLPGYTPHPGIPPAYPGHTRRTARYWPCPGTVTARVLPGAVWPVRYVPGAVWLVR